jgi:flagellar motor component MotA
MVSWIGLIITLILAVGSVLFNATDFLKILDVSSVLYILGGSVASLIAALFTGLAAYRVI